MPARSGPRRPRPDWWEWDLQLTPHVETRMEDRGLSEIELRNMIQRAHSYRRHIVTGRWILDARHHRRDWAVIVEPDPFEQVLVVVTTYPRRT